MTSQMVGPAYESHSIDYFGNLSQLVKDLHGIKILEHELIQNADDAKDETGRLAAKEFVFDLRDDALYVSNDAKFRQEDFNRIKLVSSGTKRDESGTRTTGAFGMGFMSVLQVTDHPEIYSGGRHWILYPEEQRFHTYIDNSVKGTLFKLPWAFENSSIRQKLKASPITRGDIDLYANEAESVLPQSAIFLRSLERLEVRRNGKAIRAVKRIKNGNIVRIESDNTSQNWTIFEGQFTDEANSLRKEYGSLIKLTMNDQVEIGVPDFQLESGLLYVTLPTEQSTGLPFQINADFFPYSNRRFVALDSGYESKWNRAAISAAARLLGLNLEEIRKLFEKYPANFWFFIGQIYQLHQTQKDLKQPFGQFWLEVQDRLKSGSNVFTESGKWLWPTKVRIPTGDEEEDAVPVLSDLGIEIVHHEIRRRYRNILTTSGVQAIKAIDILDALQRHKVVTRPRSATDLPKVLQSPEARSLLWKGINAMLENARGVREQSDARKTISECSLAPGSDGRFWPCRAVYKTDKQTSDLFSSLLANASFLSETKVPLFDKLCPDFSASLALEELTRLDAAIIEAALRQGRPDSPTLLQWFDGKKSELTGDKNLRERLANLPIIPSGGKLRPLRGLWLPGGFDDPLGLTDLVDTSKLKGLSDFLMFLGAKELTFADYARHYVPQAFSIESRVIAQIKREIIALLARHIGEIKDDPHIKLTLANSNIVECIKDGLFRQPSKVYMSRPEVREVLGDLVHYALLPEKSQGVADLYRWLEVAEQPRVEDILRIIDEVRAKPPVQRSRELVAKIIESLGRLPDAMRNRYQGLKAIPWLPAEGDQSTWYRPSDLYASYNKTLFESQARFIDIPVRAQQQVTVVLQFLGVNLSPKPYQVVAHLLKCVADVVDPPQGIYLWLNNNGDQPGVLAPLKEKPCLHVQRKYYRPDQVFWGQHPFGRFRIALGPELQQYAKLLMALGIRQNPDHTDAMKVLAEIAREVGSSPLRREDTDVVMSCWVMLNDALQQGQVTSSDIDKGLEEIKCVPNRKDYLYPPSWVFFEDRPGLAEKFQLVPNNTILRPERAWQAMAAAGVKPISEVVTSEIVEATNPWEDGWLTRTVMERSPQIKRVIESISPGIRDDGAILLKDLRFFQADNLRVVWHLSAFNKKEDSLPETVSAHLLRSNKLIYFKLYEGNVPWIDLARELAHALTPGEHFVPVSLGIKTILEAANINEADRLLDTLGLAHIQELTPVVDSANVIIQNFDERPTSGELQKEVTLSQEATTSGIEEQTHQGEEVKEEPPAELETAGPASQNNEGAPFAQRFYEAQTVTPSAATDSHIWLPEGGPRTEESARAHTEQSIQFGRQGTTTPKIVMRWEPKRAAKALENEFKRMVHGDYGKRCQICSRTFKTRSGEPQAFVVHIVKPSADSRTNHFGDLVGLCAWHSELVQHGQWAWIDSETGEPMQDWERLQVLFLNAPRRTDESGNIYVGLLMRFWNVYQDRGPEPKTVDEEIRYSIPHWKYLCELLIAKEG